MVDAASGWRTWKEGRKKKLAGYVLLGSVRALVAAFPSCERSGGHPVLGSWRTPGNSIDTHIFDLRSPFPETQMEIFLNPQEYSLKC